MQISTLVKLKSVVLLQCSQILAVRTSGMVLMQRTRLSPQTVGCVDLRSLLLVLVFFRKVQEVRHDLHTHGNTRYKHIPNATPSFGNDVLLQRVCLRADLGVARAGRRDQSLLHRLAPARRPLAAAGSAAPVGASQQEAQHVEAAPLGGVHEHAAARAVHVAHLQATGEGQRLRGGAPGAKHLLPSVGS